jgi:predicted Zn-dependent protease
MWQSRNHVKTRRRRWALRGILLVIVLAGLACHAWAHVEYRAAGRALTRHDLARAQVHLAHCLCVWFWSADTYLLAARTARRAGDFDQAENYLRTCRELGGSEEALALEYKLLRVQQGELARMQGSLVALVVQGDPRTPLIAEILLPAFLQAYQLNDAMACVQHWLKCEPDRVEAWRYYAKLCEYNHNGEEALRGYRRVVELEPDNDEVRLILAGQLIHEHRAQEALEHFKFLRPRLGEQAQVLGGMACCYRELNHPDEARQLLEEVLNKDPQNALALGERGRLALQFETPAEAENWLRRAVAERPAERELLYSLIQCLQRLGKTKEVADVQAQLKKTEKELDRLDEITRKIARDPHNADLRYEAGQIMLRNGQETEGLRWLGSALHEDPAHAATLQTLAEHDAQNPLVQAQKGP